MNTAEAIRIEGVSKRFGKTQALEGVGFVVPSGSVFGLLGPNGAGKTTLFSILANFLRADAGSATALGIDTRRVSDLRGRMSILPQDALFQRNIRVIDQLAFFRQLGGATKARAQREAMEALEKVGLEKFRRRRAQTLSHGMSKRMGIAQAFLGSPEVVLLDEPTAGLDPQNARKIRDLIRQFRKQAATVVVSSHNLAEIQELCDHVAILDRGKLVASGSVAEITREGKKLAMSLSRALSDEETGALSQVNGVAAFEHQGLENGYLAALNLAEGRNADAVSADLLGRLLAMGVVPREWREGATLEEFFLKLTDKENGGAGKGAPPAA
jgi:ABC-2 type transport system ATP-binding protein